MLDKKDKLYDSKHLKADDVKKWIKEGPDPRIVEEVKRFGEYIGKELKFKVNKGKGKPKTIDETASASQVRQVFTKVKSIEAKGGLRNKDEFIEFLMIKPLLAYSATRQKKTGLFRLKERLDWAIDEVAKGEDSSVREQRFKNFVRFFEAILAYHKAADGK